MRSMKARTRRAVTIASILAIAVGVALLVAGQGGKRPDIPPTIQQAVVQPQGEGQERSIDWGQLPCNVIAWVYVPGTSIDYPVVMGSDQDPGFYLFHDVEGIYSPWGTPYVANGCEQGLDSPLVMIYGHHMSDGTMFADLANYSGRAFAEDHGEIILYTRERTIHLEPRVVNVINAYAKSVRLDFEDQEELDAYMADEAAEGEVTLGGVPEGQKVYAFVTCSYETSNSRTVVYATEVMK